MFVIQHNLDYPDKYSVSEVYKEPGSKYSHWLKFVKPLP